MLSYRTNENKTLLVSNNKLELEIREIHLRLKKNQDMVIERSKV